MGAFDLTVTHQPELIGVYADSRDALLKCIADIAAAHLGAPHDSVLMIRMPCGDGVIYSEIADIPHESVPCTCGRENHYFIQYGDAT